MMTEKQLSLNGKIIKGVGGFYYVHLHDKPKIYECKAKGVFRNQNIKPAVGDNVVIDVISEENLTGNITAICDRTNKLIRPAVANVDQAVIIFALANPEPNYNLLDRFLIMMDTQEVKTIICLNKSDLVDEQYAMTIKEIYENCGYDVIITSTCSTGQCSEKDSSDTMRGIDDLRNLILGRTTVFAGPSGVGKSSLLNSLRPDANVETGSISEKIKRGKHTTRHSELIYVEEDTYIMDTPGFSSLYVEDMEPEMLKEYYNEFAAYRDSCRFNECVHINEPDCGVKLALEQGKISELRYNNYKQMYEELKSKRRW